MQNGTVSAAVTVLMLALTGCGQLGGVCEDDCGETEGTAGTGGMTQVEPGVPPDDAKPIPQGEIVIGYIPTWGAKLSSYATPAILSRLTHAAIAFAMVDATGGVKFSDPNDVRSFVALAHSFNVKVLVSIGGASGGDAIEAQIVPANLPTFVANIMKLVDDNQLDGVDVDIEGNSVNENYGPLVDALNTEIRARSMTMSAAVGNWFEQRIPQTALEEFDFVSVMAYDACGTWTSACDHSTLDLATSQIAHWVNVRSMPAEKMVLGVPFYGYSWTGDSAALMSYRDILKVKPDAWSMDRFDQNGTTYSYNGKGTIAAKVALGKQYGGVMIWELASDDVDLVTDQLNEHSLLRTVNDSY
jgi:chitinase